MNAGLSDQRAAVDNGAGKAGHELEMDRLIGGRYRAAIGDATVVAAIPEYANTGYLNTHVSGRQRRRDGAAVNDPTRNRRHGGNMYAALSRRDEAAIDDSAGTACAEHGYPANQYGVF